MEQKKQKEVKMCLERLPSSLLINEVLLRLEIEDLCSVACVSKAMNFSVSQARPSISSLNLSAPAPDAQTLNAIIGGCSGLRSLTVNCLRLDDSSVGVMLGPQLQELTLLSCSSLSYQLCTSIGQACPNLRVLVLELVDKRSFQELNENLDRLQNGCLWLESLSVKIRGTDVGVNAFQPMNLSRPFTLKSMKLQSVFEQNAINLIYKVRFGAVSNENHVQSDDVSIPISPLPSAFTLQRLSLVLDVISDDLIMTIGINLPHLVELDLEDRPIMEPSPFRDLTTTGLQYVANCHHLVGLSLVRSRQAYEVSFKRVTDLGIFLLAEGCKGLESLRLCGFSKVSDAGYASILRSCSKLKKFEARNDFLLSDLAFVDVNKFPCSLVEVRLLSCSLITCETVKKLTHSGILELLDLGGCTSIADSCLSSISSLCSLTTLNLTGTDITDYGLSVLGQGYSPITHLCLRRCRNVTDEGVSHLFHSGGTIGKTLSTLDLGHILGITDKSVLTIAMAGTGISELCLRYCLYVTDSSLEALATRKKFQGECKSLRKLDLLSCIGLSLSAFKLLKRPFFPGLQWLGVGKTSLTVNGCLAIDGIRDDRPWLTVCSYGCEMGCYDGWQFHRARRYLNAPFDKMVTCYSIS